MTIDLTEMERQALQMLVAREINRLQVLDKEADYDELGFRHAAREVMSDIHLKLRAAREPVTQTEERK